ncbi:porin [Thiohalorhabdus methylotrophus]|uniref:Porin n=1 Tax=Thiohalorhabdus methylotrophus TaxID=3242694 RepID=A0ABV4TY29_9GAMM
MHYKSLSVAAAGALLMSAATSSQAASWEAGDWTLSMSGQVNVHAAMTSCESASSAVSVDAGLACAQATSSTDQDNFSVQNGLLPASFVFGASTVQNGWDLHAQLGLYPGIATNDTLGGGGPNLRGGGAGQNTGLGSTGLDVRQVFLKFGKDEVGTFKLGRDYGIFGFDAIINDMTIQGMGPIHGSVGAPANTTLGSIGVGYLYTDTLAQVNYTTPNFSGFTATVGVFEPLDTFSLADITASNAQGTISSSTTGQLVETPGYHGRVKYRYGAEMVEGFVSASFIQQDMPAVGNNGSESTGYDVTATLNVADLSLLGSYYAGEGLGTTALFFDGFDGQGDKRDSDGFLAQATYAFGDTKLGVNYGVSNLDQTDNDPDTLLDKHEKYTVGVYHNMTDNLLLVGEYSDFTAENHNGNDNSSSNYSVGAVLSF